MSTKDVDKANEYLRTNCTTSVIGFNNWFMLRKFLIVLFKLKIMKGMR